MALLGKQLWRLITKPSSLCARTLKARYFPNTSILDASLGHNPSFIWRSVFSAKSNSNESCQKWGVKCHFTTLNNVLAALTNVFTPMVDAKMGCHFNNSMFLIKKYN